ncbi:hypothetical protein [Paraoerskovia marina]|uniref:hypothetical protein n=1 Tax=Paraoerskovia marina TaxID=545619 RepID=UPI0012DCFA11|nr:hypothetical protein [Paraoerskovia marina]
MSNNLPKSGGSTETLVDDEVVYDVETVRAIRGREASTIKKWLDEGWELESESKGKLRT